MIGNILGMALSWLIIFPTLYLIGFRFRRLITLQDPLLIGVLYYAIGMAVCSYLVIGLSALHLLNSRFIWTVLILIFFSHVQLISHWIGWIKLVFSDLMKSENILERFCQICFLLAFLVLLAGSFSPELGGDALCYQLNLPKIFLIRGSIHPIYYDVNSYFPLFMNNLYLIGFATGGMLSAKLFHFLTGILLFVILKHQIKEDTNNADLAYFLALAFILTPVVYNMLSTTYVDVGLALYIFLAFIVLQHGIRSADLRSFFLSGLFLGCAISIKYLGLISAVALGCVFIYGNLIQSRARFIQKFLIWIGGFALSFGYWMIRNWYLTGNPLYPYLGFIFKTEPIPGMKYDLVGVGFSFFHLVTVFLNMFINPTAFGTFSDRIGIFYLLLIPFALAAVTIPKARSYVVFTVVFLIIWFYVCQAGRYLIPALPFMILAAAAYLDRISLRISSLWKSVVKISSLLILSIYLVSGIIHYRYSYFLLFGKWTWQDYLLNLERTSSIASWVNENLPKNAKILLGREPRQFYFDRPLIRDVALKYRTHYDQKNFNVDSFSDFLKREQITHILMSESVNTQLSVSEKANLLSNLTSSSHVHLIHEVISKDIRDDQYHYRLYELQ